MLISAELLSWLLGCAPDKITALQWSGFPSDSAHPYQQRVTRGRARMMNPPCVPVDEPAAKRPCRIDSAQDLLSLMNATEETKETVTPETAPSSVHKPKLQTSRQAPVVPAQRPQARAAQ